MSNPTETTQTSVSQITTDTALEKQQKISEAYIELKHAFDTQQPIEVELTEKTRGGFKSQYKNISLFMPFSSYVAKRNAFSEEELDAAIGSKILVKIKEFSEDEFGKVIKINHKEVLEDAQWKDITTGKIVEVKVKTVVPDKGVVVELPAGLEAFVPISYIHSQRINRIEDFVNIGDAVKGEIIEINREARRIIVSLKAVASEKVNQYFDTVAIGDKVTGKVETITNSMVFFNIAPEITGVVRAREVSWTLRHIKLNDYFEVGKEYELEIINLEKETQRIELSYKRTQPNNWEEVANKYQIGLTYSAVVEFIPPTGRGAEITINNEIDAFMPKQRAGALYNGNKPTFKQKDIIQIKVFNKDAERYSILVESALKQEGTSDEHRPRNAQQSTNTEKKSSFSLGDLLSESSKKALKK